MPNKVAKKANPPRAPSAPFEKGGGCSTEVLPLTCVDTYAVGADLSANAALLMALSHKAAPTSCDLELQGMTVAYIGIYFELRRDVVGRPSREGVPIKTFEDEGR